mmetsp:Transcript_28377/g.51594  ORF Transcript_28377/g.51594 Transcript_28377/m.51594 type:complete len:223 (-) Transcript_28377:54-722(-)
MVCRAQAVIFQHLGLKSLVRDSAWATSRLFLKHLHDLKWQCLHHAMSTCRNGGCIQLGQRLPQAVSPWIKLLLQTKVMLIISKAQPVKGLRAKLLESRMQLPSSIVELSVVAVAEPENCELKLAQKRLGQRCSNQCFPQPTHVHRWITLACRCHHEDGNSEIGNILYGQIIQSTWMSEVEASPCTFPGKIGRHLLSCASLRSIVDSYLAMWLIFRNVHWCHD